MDNYIEQAKNFLSATHTSLEIIFLATEQNSVWNDTHKRNHYLFVLKNKKGYLVDDFWDSVHHTLKHLKPTEYDILSCLECWYVGPFHDFCNEFGYNADSVSAYKTYNACVRQYHALRKMFNDEEMEMLREIR